MKQRQKAHYFQHCLNIGNRPGDLLSMSPTSIPPPWWKRATSASLWVKMQTLWADGARLHSLAECWRIIHPVLIKHLKQAWEEKVTSKRSGAQPHTLSCPFQVRVSAFIIITVVSSNLTQPLCHALFSIEGQLVDLRLRGSLWGWDTASHILFLDLPFIGTLYLLCNTTISPFLLWYSQLALVIYLETTFSV